MSRTVSVSEARSTLPEVIERVVNGEEVTLTRHGVPVAVVVRPDALRVRRAGGALAGADRVRELLDDARREPLPARPGVDAARAEELVATIRDHREHRSHQGT